MYTALRSILTELTNNDLKNTTWSTRKSKQKERKKFRRRAAIEPVIGHRKKYFRMGQNYLMGSKFPKINALLAATGWNLKKLIEKLRAKFNYFIFYTLQMLPILALSKKKVTS